MAPGFCPRRLTDPARTREALSPLRTATGDLHVRDNAACQGCFYEVKWMALSRWYSSREM